MDARRGEIEQETGIKLDPLLKNLCCFTLDEIKSGTPTNPVPELWAKVAAVYENILQRGLPTWPSLLVERALLGLINAQLLPKVNGNFAIEDNNATRISGHSLARTHIIIDPRVDFEDWGKKAAFDSEEERTFYTQTLPNALGLQVTQLVEPQRPLCTIIGNDAFKDQRVDFACEAGQLKVVFEIDGIQHARGSQQELDTKRNLILQQNDWQVVRIPAREIRQGTIPPEVFDPVRQVLQQDPYFDLLRQNFQTPLWQTPEALIALQLVLTPFAVARIQKALLRAVKAGILSPDAKLWNIAVIERDVPGAQLAVADFVDFFRHFLELTGSETKIPAIKVRTYQTPEFAGCTPTIQVEELQKYSISSETRVINEKRELAADGEGMESEFKADLLLDISILQRGTRSNVPSEISDHLLKPEALTFIIRSTWTGQDDRVIHTQGPINYGIDDTKKGAAEFFLQNLFRKVEFREGQFEVLQRTLNLQPVIALLPTGAGKSICYQLSTFLQPGVTLVVDPLKSLMVDQADNLKAAHIDNIQFINSDQTPRERKITTEAMVRGKYQIVFISPERFQIKDFRRALTQLTHDYLVPYLVIDEAHCVSEWGHDFRTAYLNLAKTALRYCQYHGTKPVIIALTGTASISVLTDVQREIGVIEEEAKIQPTSFDRKELHFKIEKVPSLQKREKLREILQELPQLLEVDPKVFFTPAGHTTIAGIVFAPHVNGDYGVYDLCNWVRAEITKEVEFFSGEVPKKRMDREQRPVMPREEYDEYKRQTQQKFKENKFPLLVATKAFGMGIDKQNIRYTIHYGIPQSLEGFYQEAGRAGRDRQPAMCALIFSNDNPENADQMLDTKRNADEIGEIPEPNKKFQGDIHRMLYFHKKAFQGVKVELQVIAGLMSSHIQPKLEALPEEGKAEVIIEYGSNANKMELEKALFRLSLIGVVDDYTIDYNAGAFQAKVAKRKPEAYLKHLQEYMRRYRAEEYIPTNIQIIQNNPDEKIFEPLLKQLLTFIYEEIEKKRRTAIYNMADVARRSNTGEEIRRAILTYLELSPFTSPLNALSLRMNPDDWWNLLRIVQQHRMDVDMAMILLGGCRRTLESFPDHPGLLLIIAIARLMSPDPDVQLAVNNIESGFQALQRFSELTEQIPTIAGELIKWIQGLVKDGARVASQVAEVILKIRPTRPMARSLYDRAPDTATNILLNCIVQDVKSFNQQFLEGVNNAQ